MSTIRIGAAVLAAAAAITLTACSVGPKATGVSPPQASQPAAGATTSAPAPVNQYLNLPVGSTVNISNNLPDESGTVTVTAVRATTQPASEFGEAPQDGYYVIATVKWTAAAGKQLSLNPLDFYAKVNGQHVDGTHGNAMMSAVNDVVAATTLNSGESLTGEVGFDVPATHGEIVYAPGFGGDALASWAF